MNPIRSFQGVSLANGSLPEELGPGLNTSEEVVAAGGTANTLVKNPANTTLAAFLALSGLSTAGWLLVRQATAADTVSAAQTNWVIPLLGADTLP